MEDQPNSKPTSETEIKNRNSPTEEPEIPVNFNFESFATKFLKNIQTKDEVLQGRSNIKTFNTTDTLFWLKNNEIPATVAATFMNYLVTTEKISAFRKGQLIIMRKFSLDYDYAIIEEPFDWKIMFGVIAVLFLVLAAAMFRLWPECIKNKIHYLYYLVIGFIIFLVVLGIIRLIIFGITFFLDYPGWWLFPNLFADVGFFESFVPLWERGKGQETVVEE